MGIPNVLGIENLGRKSGQFTGLPSSDMSGTAYLPSGEISFAVNCGWLTKQSVVRVGVSATQALSVIKLIEVIASRTPGTNGQFVVKLQDGSAALADLYFNWSVMNY